MQSGHSRVPGRPQSWPAPELPVRRIGLSAAVPGADGQPNQCQQRNGPNRLSRRGGMLGAPLRARSAHVVQLGAVGIEQRLGKVAEQVAEPYRQGRAITAEVAYANYGPAHQHGDAAALHLPPSTAAFAY